MQEPPSTSPTPTSPSDVDIRGDDDDINSNASPAKRKAVESPISVQRPPKVARFNENGRRTQISFDKWTNVPPPSSLTQPPKSAKKPRSSFLSQPTRTPPMRPDKGKNRASSRQSTSSLSDHISNMVEKQNQRYRRKETARKTNRTRRVTTSGLIRDIQKSSSKFVLLILSFDVLTSVPSIKAALKFLPLPLACDEVRATTSPFVLPLDSFP
jgi:hypothetical protein